MFMKEPSRVQQIFNINQILLFGEYVNVRESFSPSYYFQINTFLSHIDTTVVRA
jgi:hypothetical protein